MESIKERGLVPRQGSGLFNHGAYGAHSQGKVFLSAHHDAASDWHDKVENMLFSAHDDEAKHRAVMLRVKHRKTAVDSIGNKDVDGSRETKSAVSPDELEYHDHKHGWRPIEHWAHGRDSVPSEDEAHHPGTEAARVIEKRKQAADRARDAKGRGEKEYRDHATRLEKERDAWQNKSPESREKEAARLLAMPTPIPGYSNLTAAKRRILGVDAKGKAKLHKAYDPATLIKAALSGRPRADTGWRYVVDLRKGQTGGGPFIGPRGGKWADAAHTIPWHDDVDHRGIHADAHSAVKDTVVSAAHRAVAAGAHAGSLKYFNAGGEGILFRDKSGRVYKVARSRRRPERLRSEAEAGKVLADHGLAPKVHHYDAKHDVVVRDHAEGRPGTWSESKTLQATHDRVTKVLAAHDFSRAEFKEDSYIVDGGSHKLADVGFVSPTGKRLAAALKRRDISETSPDQFGTQMDINDAFEDGALSYDEAAGLLRKLGPGQRKHGLEILEGKRERLAKKAYAPATLIKAALSGRRPRVDTGWRTMPNRTKVKFGAGGVVESGPARMVGRTLGKTPAPWSGRHAHAGSQEAWEGLAEGYHVTANEAGIRREGFAPDQHAETGYGGGKDTDAVWLWHDEGAAEQSGARAGADRMAKYMIDQRRIAAAKNPRAHAESLLMDRLQRRADEVAARHDSPKHKAQYDAWLAEADALPTRKRAEAAMLRAHAERVRAAREREAKRDRAAALPSAVKAKSARVLAGAERMLSLQDKAGDVPANDAERAMALYAHAEKQIGMATAVSSLNTLRALAAHAQDPSVVPVRFDPSKQRRGDHTSDGWAAVSPGDVFTHQGVRKAIRYVVDLRKAEQYTLFDLGARTKGKPKKKRKPELFRQRDVAPKVGKSGQPQVIKIGPQGGKIIGYRNGKPIYLGDWKPPAKAKPRTRLKHPATAAAVYELAPADYRGWWRLAKQNPGKVYELPVDPGARPGQRVTMAWYQDNRVAGVEFAEHVYLEAGDLWRVPKPAGGWAEAKVTEPGWRLKPAGNVADRVLGVPREINENLVRFLVGKPGAAPGNKVKEEPKAKPREGGGRWFDPTGNKTVDKGLRWISDHLDPGRVDVRSVVIVEGGSATEGKSHAGVYDKDTKVARLSSRHGVGRTIVHEIGGHATEKHAEKGFWESQHSAALDALGFEVWQTRPGMFGGGGTPLVVQKESSPPYGKNERGVWPFDHRPNMPEGTFRLLEHANIAKVPYKDHAPTHYAYTNPAEFRAEHVAMAMLQPDEHKLKFPAEHMQIKSEIGLRQREAGKPRTVDFSQSVSGVISAVNKSADIGLKDVSVEVGHYDRDSFRGTLSQWDKVHAALVEKRKGTTGALKRSFTAAIGRIPTTAQRDAWDADRALKAEKHPPLKRGEHRVHHDDGTYSSRTSKTKSYTHAVVYTRTRKWAEGSIENHAKLKAEYDADPERHDSAHVAASKALDAAFADHRPVGRRGRVSAARSAYEATLTDRLERAQHRTEKARAWLDGNPEKDATHDVYTWHTSRKNASRSLAADARDDTDPLRGLSKVRIADVSQHRPHDDDVSKGGGVLRYDPATLIKSVLRGRQRTIYVMGGSGHV